MEEEAEQIMRRHGLPEEVRRRLAVGLAEAAIRAREVAERRTLGTEPLVMDVLGTEPPSPPPPAAPETPPPAPPPPPPKPSLSSLVEPFFEHRAKRDKATFKQIAMERTTLRLFLEVAGT